jgi:hypothetical protein
LRFIFAKNPAVFPQSFPVKTRVISALIQLRNQAERTWVCRILPALIRRLYSPSVGCFGCALILAGNSLQAGAASLKWRTFAFQLLLPNAPLLLFGFV